MMANHCSKEPNMRVALVYQATERIPQTAALVTTRSINKGDHLYWNYGAFHQKTEPWMSASMVILCRIYTAAISDCQSILRAAYQCLLLLTLVSVWADVSTYQHFPQIESFNIHCNYKYMIHFWKQPRHSLVFVNLCYYVFSINQEFFKRQTGHWYKR